MHGEEKEFDEFALREGGFEGCFNRFYPGAYAAFEQMLREASKRSPSPCRILDIGCGDGWTASRLDAMIRGVYLGLDLSAVCLSQLEKRAAGFSQLRVETREAGAVWLLAPGTREAVRSRLAGLPDLILCNAALHQIRKRVPGILPLVSSWTGLCRPGGLLVVGDYTVPPGTPGKDLDAMHHWIRTRTGQTPTPPETFPDPESVREALSAGGCELLASNQVRARPDLPLYYWVLLMRRSMDLPPEDRAAHP